MNLGFCHKLQSSNVITSALVLDGNRNMTQSIGLLSYTFLRKTGREDIVVPMVSPI